MQALVTGGSGFIGSEVISQLRKQGMQVRALLRRTSSRQNLQGLDYETVLGDLGEVDSLRSAVKGVDYVFHLAGSTSARTREEFFRHNSAGTANLARACAEANPGLKRFVFVSSIAACGPATSATPRREDEAEAPISVYGESKLSGEKELELVVGGRFPVTIVRPPAVYGPRDKAIFEFVKILNGGLMPILKSNNPSGEKFYSVVHVEDLVRGIVLSGLAEKQGRHEVFFLSGDGVYTWGQMMSAAAAALGKKPMRVKGAGFALTGLAAFYGVAGWLAQKQFPLTLDKIRELRSDYWICSNERAKDVLGFQPRWNIAEGMAQTVSWYRQHGWV